MVDEIVTDTTTVVTDAGDKKDAAAVVVDKTAASDKSIASTVVDAPAKTVEEMRAFLTEKGGKADELMKLDEAGLKAAYTKANEPPPKIEKAGDYKDFKVPDGVKLDEAQLGEFKTTAAKAGLSQESAQEFLNLHTKLVSEAANAPYKLWEKTQGDWKSAVQKDAEIGGKAFADMQTHVAKAIDSVGGKEAAALRDALDATGAGNHPEVVRFFYRIGKLFSEGGPTLGKGPSEQGQAKPSAAQVLYPKQGGEVAA